MKKRLLCMGLVAVFALSALAFAGCGEDKTAELEKQLSEMQATVQTQKEELDALKKENTDFQAQIGDLRGQMGDLREQIKILKNPDAYGLFYSLQEASDCEILDRENLQKLVGILYNTKDLDEETEQKILHDYKLLDIPQGEELWLEYFGIYNHCYAVCVHDPEYDLAFEEAFPFEIAGIKFYLTMPFVQLWKPIEKM